MRALAGVDLELFPGGLVVLLGPSGSGKSTLLNILGGLDRASSGTVTFKGLELTALPLACIVFRFQRLREGSDPFTCRLRAAALTRPIFVFAARP